MDSTYFPSPEQANEFFTHQDLVKAFDKSGLHRTLFDDLDTPYCSCGKNPHELTYGFGMATSVRLGIKTNQARAAKEPEAGHIAPTNNPLFLRWIAGCEPCQWKSKSSRKRDKVLLELEVHRIIYHPPTE
jgi:hypothetical protein